MDEKQIIKQLKELHRIKPNSDWASLTKNRIFGREKEEEISWLFTPIRRPALVVAPLVVLAAVLGGLFVYFNFLPQSFQVPIVTGPSEKQEAEEIVASLAELQESLKQITLGLNDLKNAKDPSQAFVMTKIVKVTAKEGERVINGVKDSLPKGVYGSLIDGYGEVYEKSNDMEKEFLESCINSLKQKSLTEEDELRLQKAEEDYNEIIIMSLYNKYFNEN